MKEIVTIIRPEKLETLKTVLEDVSTGGMTISTVMGCGTQKGKTEPTGVTEIKGIKTNINLLPKIKVEVVVNDTDVEKIVMEIQEKCASGHVGDGKIFVKKVEDVIRIRTGERGSRAI